MSTCSQTLSSPVPHHQLLPTHLFSISLNLSPGFAPAPFSSNQLLDCFFCISVCVLLFLLPCFALFSVTARLSAALDRHHLILHRTGLAVPLLTTSCDRVRCFSNEAKLAKSRVTELSVKIFTIISASSFLSLFFPPF